MSKKRWCKPKISVLKAGSAEASVQNGNDGGGGQTGS